MALWEIYINAILMRAKCGVNRAGSGRGIVESGMVKKGPSWEGGRYLLIVTIEGQEGNLHTFLLPSGT